MLSTLDLLIRFIRFGKFTTKSNTGANLHFLVALSFVADEIVVVPPFLMVGISI